MFLKSAIELLNSRSIALYFLGLWMAIIVSSIWWLSPASDDGYYLHQIFSFVEFGTIGLFHIETFYKTFLGFPGYPTVQGLFFVVWDVVGLPINIYTYKSFQIATTALLVLLSTRLIFEIVEDQNAQINSPYRTTSAWGRISVMLVTLGASPFLIDTLYLRPESLGLLFVVTGILAFRRALSPTRRQTIWIAIGGVSVGAAATTHPSFLVAGGVLGLFMVGYFLRRKKWLFASLGIGFAILPILGEISWFLANGDYAVGTLWAHVSDRTTAFGGSIQTVVSMILRPLSEPTLGSLFFAGPLLVLSLLVVVVVTLMGWRLVGVARGRLHLGNWIGTKIAVDAFFLGALLNFLISKDGRIQILTALAFAAALALATSLRPISATPQSIGNKPI